MCRYRPSQAQVYSHMLWRLLDSVERIRHVNQHQARPNKYANRYNIYIAYTHCNHGLAEVPLAYHVDLKYEVWPRVDSVQDWMNFIFVFDRFTDITLHSRVSQDWLACRYDNLSAGHLRSANWLQLATECFVMFSEHCSPVRRHGVH